MNPFLRDVVIAVVAVGAVILCQTIVGKQKFEKKQLGKLIIQSTSVNLTLY